MQSTHDIDYGIPFKSGNDIRKSFIDYFTAREHKFVPSDAIAPKDDPTILFTNAGMNQFKALFLGDNRDNLKRAVNSQKCLRVSGKHNDLEEVGRDGHHHTFFEMLGNWSFGDYYKKEAIAWAWDYLTNTLKLPKNRLFATVYKDDDEAFELWKELTDLDESRIMRFTDDNFWEMGAVGPCGPCSEIHFDTGDLATQEATYKDPVGGVNGENERYIEIWNLVFMQNERLQDGSLKKLTDCHVDTGAGLERLARIVQNQFSNYESDLFAPIIEKVAQDSKTPYQQNDVGTPHRVIADHIRTLVFAVGDGVTPGNEGRGYVIRRILRRASRFAYNLGLKEPYLCKLVETVVGLMGNAYPLIKERQAYITQVIEAEESRFLKTLGQGLSRLDKSIKDLNKKKKDTILGEDVFLFHDTFGFPSDLTRMIAAEHNLKIDEAGYSKCMQEQKERARKAAKFDDRFGSNEGWVIFSESKETHFIGYDHLDGQCKTRRFLEDGDQLFIVLDKTPFYAEAGGQVGDIGTLKNDQVTLKVTDTLSILDTHIHKCELISGLITTENLKELNAQVDSKARSAAKANHSATHLLHAALRQQLGPHVEQQGSYVGPDRLRFDFTHHQGVSNEQLKSLEQQVNLEIQNNHSVNTQICGFEEAKEKGAMALFGEKYGDKVRVLSMGEVSIELCGGTHVTRTGDIGAFKITSESSIAAGVRRIEAVTGLSAVDLAFQESSVLKSISQTFKVPADSIIDKVKEMQQKIKDLDKELSTLQSAQLSSLIKDMLANANTKHNGFKVLVAALPAEKIGKHHLQKALDIVWENLPDGVAILTHNDGANLAILASVGQQLKGKLAAGQLVKEVSALADGKGGGRPDKARAGSKAVDKEPLVLEKSPAIIKQMLN